MLDDVFHVCEHMRVHEREKESVCMKHVSVCVKKLRSGPLVIACLSVCQRDCQPSNHHKLTPFTTSAAAERFHSHHHVPLSEPLHSDFLKKSHIIRFCRRLTLSLLQSQSQTSCLTHKHTPPHLLLSQNMTFFLSSLPSPEFSWQWS